MMDLLNLVRLSVVIISMAAAKRMIEQMSYQDHKRLRSEQAKVLTRDPRQGQVMCDRLSKEPYFGVEMLVGTTWRIYYSWNINLQKECLDMIFRNATPRIIKRVYNEMNEHLEVEPYWPAATFLVTMSRAGHEMLLFADQGAAGRFSGVPNIIRNGNIRRIAPPRRTVPLLRFHLKLLYGGKYLLMADCQIGVTTLSARRRAVTYRSEIESIAETVNFGPGLFACQSDLNKNEGILKE